MNLWEYVPNFIKASTPMDLVDILVVAFLVYQGIKLVRETRANQLIKGLGALLLLYFVASQLKLKTLSFLMGNVLQIGAVALLVVFQPELRRALEQVGRTKIHGLSLFGGPSDQEDEQSRWKTAIMAICEGCASLSRQKVGALIVLERETRLGEIIKTGTIVDAAPSAELFGTLFFTNSPLHDGAVVMRGGRVYAAGCFLPLSQNYEISREMGTRHRAALGMSENSDAMVVVVSEETGVITVAQNGRLERNFTIDRLEKVLCDGILRDSSEDSSPRKPIFWKVKKS